MAYSFDEIWDTYFNVTSIDMISLQGFVDYLNSFNHKVVLNNTLQDEEEDLNISAVMLNEEKCSIIYSYKSTNCLYKTDFQLKIDKEKVAEVKPTMPENTIGSIAYKEVGAIDYKPLNTVLLDIDCSIQTCVSMQPMEKYVFIGFVDIENNFKTIIYDQEYKTYVYGDVIENVNSIPEILVVNNRLFIIYNINNTLYNDIYSINNGILEKLNTIQLDYIDNNTPYSIINLNNQVIINYIQNDILYAELYHINGNEFNFVDKIEITNEINSSIKVSNFILTNKTIITVYNNEMLYSAICEINNDNIILKDRIILDIVPYQDRPLNPDIIVAIEPEENYLHLYIDNINFLSKYILEEHEAEEYMNFEEVITIGYSDKKLVLHHYSEHIQIVEVN